MNNAHDTGPGQRGNVKKSEPNHFAYIDAVRGLAFLSVLVMHSAIVTGFFFGKGVLSQGNYGVQLFFLASAVTLCHSMAERQKIDKYPVFYFYLRRLFRIAPLFWAAMIFYWTFPQVIPPLWYAEWVPSGVHPSYFALTALFLHGWHPSVFNCIVPGGWSIAVEMNFYIFFPLIFWLLSSQKRAAAAVLIGLLYANVVVHILSHVRPYLYPGISESVWSFYVIHCFPAQIVVFLIGFLAYHLLQNQSITALRKSRFWAGCLFGFASLTLLCLLHGGRTGVVPLYLFIVLCLAGIIISISGGQMPWIVNPVICYIGKISYSCYLVHFAVLYSTIRLLGVPVTMDFPLYDSGHTLTNSWFFVKVFSLTLCFTAIVSTLTLHLIENPGIALGKKLIRWITAKSGAK